MSRVFLLLVVCFLVYSFFPFRKPSRKVQLVDKVCEKYVKAITKKTGLKCVGSGGEMMYDIKVIALDFRSNAEMSLEEARSLIIFCVDEFLSMVGKDGEIQKFVYEPPFSERNVEVIIFFPEEKEIDASKKKLGICCFYKGEITYKSYFEDKSKHYTILKEESYKEAKEILKQEQRVYKSKEAV